MQTVMERVYALKNVRIIYEKNGRMRFVSHLDMNRFMSRIIHRTNIPIWYTEGFNKHPYITFALPLSLGFESRYEVMDFRITDDEYSFEEIRNSFNNVLPPYLKIVDVFEPVMKPGKIAFADFSIYFETKDVGLENVLSDFFLRKEIIVSKKSKKGTISQIDIAPKIKFYEIKSNEEGFTLNLTLPAGGQDNVNPSILLEALKNEIQLPDYIICRGALYNENMEIFR